MSLQQQQHPFESMILDSPLSRFRCAGCGYGASRHSAPARCPMCSGAVWDYADWRPFADAPLTRDGLR